MLLQRVLVVGAVLPHHAQRGPAVAGHAHEALAPREVENGHRVEADAVTPSVGGGGGGGASLRLQDGAD